ncbi:MAG: FtsX-like permease family protein [Bacteroides sp.]|nr:FtsX-like permease family protein [Bacteroides sp.]
MVRYYFSMALRNLKKRPGFSLVNILGLSLGIAACLMITHYVRFHQSFDKQSEESHRTYRIQYSRWSETGDLVQFGSASPTIGPAMKARIPEVETYGRMYRVDGVFFYEDRFFEEEQVFWGESTLFDLLGLDILQGDAQTCLDEPNRVAISVSTARKYFGDADPLGKVLSRNKRELYEVTGVFADMPENMHFRADIFLSMSTWAKQVPDLFSSGWFNSGFYTYVLLQEGTDPKAVDKAIEEYMEAEFGETLRHYQMGMSFKLQPLETIHLGSHFMHELQVNADRKSIELLAVVAWFILIIAWVNFFNLTTISSIRRLREIGLRKVNGASRRQLLGQFLTESALINLLALVGALVIFEITSPLFKQLAGLPQDQKIWQFPWFWTIIIIAFLGGTFSAGIYSVTSIASNKLMQILKGNRSAASGQNITRKLLVTLQFVIALALLSATMGVYRQYLFMSKRDLGFQIDGMMVVKAPVVGDKTLVQKFSLFNQEVEMITGVQGACFSSIIPGKPNMFNRGGIHRFGDDPNNSKNFRVTETDHRYFDTYKIRFLVGEGFTGNDSIDKGRVVLNQYGALWLGFSSPEEAVGQKLVLEGQPFLISGVVIDFFQLSPKETIEPQLFRLPVRNQGYLTVNIGHNLPAEAIPWIQVLFQSFFPDNPFEYFFLDEYYHLQFSQEKRFGMVFALFSVLVILISVLGLMALSAYSAEQRKKEIGIRKVLGASNPQVFKMLFHDYLLLWFIAGLLAIPITYYLLDKWLDHFALQSSLSWWIFFIPLITVLFIALSTVWSQSRNYVAQNPVENIKYE